MGPKARFKDMQSIRNQTYSQNMHVPSRPSPRKRKAAQADSGVSSIGFGTAENREAAQAHLRAMEDIFEGRSAPLAVDSSIHPDRGERSSLPPPRTPSPAHEPQMDYEMDYGVEYGDSTPLEDHNVTNSKPSTGKPSSLASQKVDVLPAKSAAELEQRFATAFETLLPMLEQPYLDYVATIQAGTVPETIPHQEELPCECQERITHQRSIRCYMFKGIRAILFCKGWRDLNSFSLGLYDLKFTICKCQEGTAYVPSSTSSDLNSSKKFKTDDFIAKWLVKEGLFPTSPSFVKTAVSIHFLKFFGYLGLRSGGAITAFSGAMKDFYADDGIYIINKVQCAKTPTSP